MKKKKILFIHHGKGVGGAPISLLFLIKGLDRDCYDISVLFLHNSDAIKLFKDANIRILGPINVYEFSHTKIWWYRWYHMHHLFKAFIHTLKTIFFVAPYWLSLEKPDLLHLNSSPLIGWAIAAKFKKIPVIWHIREPLAYGYFGIRRLLMRCIVNRYSSAIISISRNDAKPWVGSEKLFIVPNAVDFSVFDKEKHAVKSHVPTILFVGGISKEKGTDLILRVFDRLIEKKINCRLLIAGHFQLEGNLSLRNIISPSYWYKRKLALLKKKVERHVKIVGVTQNIPQLMASSDIIVFPARVGHFARPVIEAFSMGKPVVASNLPPLDELVTNGKNGFLVSSHDINEWVGKLIFLLRHDAERKKMGEEAFKTAKLCFDVKEQVRKVEKLYESLV